MTQQQEDVHVSVGHIPSLSVLSGHFAKVKKHKAVSESSIPGDLLALMPKEMALYMHPLFVKVSMTAWEPISDLNQSEILCPPPSLVLYGLLLKFN